MTSQSGPQKDHQDVDGEDHGASCTGGAEVMERLRNLQHRQSVEHERQEEHILLLQKEQEEAVRQHQVVLQKMESLRVKLQLNDSKASRKSFLHKKQEMTSQKNRAEDENNRLQKELGEVEEQLISLQEEQEQEKRLLEKELSQLTEEMERMRGSSQEAQRRALEEEVLAVEKQRDGTLFTMEAWLREVGQYVQALHMDPSPPHLQERLHWEKQEALVRRRMEQVQVQYQGLLRQLGDGCSLEVLPGLEAPPPPTVPTVELIISQMLLSLEQATFLPPHLQLPTPHPSPMASPRTPPPACITPPVGHHSPPPPRSTPPPPAGPAGKLDLLLDQLAAKFPECSRAQLMSALQRIKSERGTMAGLSREELGEQVGLRLARPAGPSPAVRSYCLMCQHPVQPAARHPLPCAHSIHRHCISVWLRSSGNNSCPFCPAQ